MPAAIGPALADDDNKSPTNMKDHIFCATMLTEKTNKILCKQISNCNAIVTCQVSEQAEDWNGQLGTRQKFFLKKRIYAVEYTS